ncbi:F-box/LRR-repeat protein 20 isoform X2 [Nematostella vectensis]|uniref:F-box/LRR-repeat protein 20 isoform X2 n=1 Tax=Nematostella vectensis TaxID=45351 RepID=UPI002076FBFF|nr:F-box/LRR-repeat protein 20 isoform X2 [Nematostella vectensis]
MEEISICPTDRELSEKREDSLAEHDGPHLSYSKRESDELLEDFEEIIHLDEEYKVTKSKGIENRKSPIGSFQNQDNYCQEDDGGDDHNDDAGVADARDAVQSNVFDLLPEEVILEILSYIPLKQLYTSIPFVSKQWYANAKNPLLWQKLTFEETKHLTLGCFMSIIESRCPLLKELSLKCRSDLCSLDFLTIAKSSPLLQKLSLAFCSQGNIRTALQSFTEFCPQLHSISLEGCDINHDCIHTLKNLCLKYLNVSHCTKLVDESLIDLSKQHPGLVSINFDGVQWITDNAVQVMVANCWSSLKYLWLDGANLSDDGIRLISRCPKLSCRNLKTLDLSWCWDITDKGLQYIILNCSEMRYLNICGLREVTGVPLRQVPSTMPHLTELDARQCNKMRDELLYELVVKVPKLIVIDYYGDYVVPGNPKW